MDRGDNFDDHELVRLSRSTVPLVARKYDEFDFSGGLVLAMDLCRAANAHFAASEPWKLAPRADTPAGAAALAEAVRPVLEALRVAAHLLTPVVPDTAARILDTVAPDTRRAPAVGVDMYAELEAGRGGPEIYSPKVGKFVPCARAAPLCTTFMDSMNAILRCSSGEGKTGKRQASGDKTVSTSA